MKKSYLITSVSCLLIGLSAGFAAAYIPLKYPQVQLPELWKKQGLEITDMKTFIIKELNKFGVSLKEEQLGLVRQRNDYILTVPALRIANKTKAVMVPDIVIPITYMGKWKDWFAYEVRFPVKEILADFFKENPQIPVQASMKNAEVKTIWVPEKMLWPYKAERIENFVLKDTESSVPFVSIEKMTGQTIIDVKQMPAAETFSTVSLQGFNAGIPLLMNLEIDQLQGRGLIKAGNIESPELLPEDTLNMSLIIPKMNLTGALLPFGEVSVNGAMVQMNFQKNTLTGTVSIPQVKMEKEVALPFIPTTLQCSFTIHCDGFMDLIQIGQEKDLTAEDKEQLFNQVLQKTPFTVSFNDCILKGDNGGFMIDGNGLLTNEEINFVGTLTVHNFEKISPKTMVTETEECKQMRKLLAADNKVTPAEKEKLEKLYCKPQTPFDILKDLRPFLPTAKHTEANGETLDEFAFEMGKDNILINGKDLPKNKIIIQPQEKKTPTAVEPKPTGVSSGK